MTERERRRPGNSGHRQSLGAAQGQRPSSLETVDDDLERRLQLEFGRGQLQLEQQTAAEHDELATEAAPAAGGTPAAAAPPPGDEPVPEPVAVTVLRRIDELYGECGAQMRVGLTLLRDYLGSHAQCEFLDSQHLEDVVRELRPEVKSSAIYATRLRQACRMTDMPLVNDVQRGGGEEQVQAEDGTAVALAGSDHLEDLIVEYFKRRIRNQCQSIDLRRLYRRAELEVLEELDMQVVDRD